MQPADVPAVNRILKRAYQEQQAPIVAFARVQAQDPFRVLVSTILSSRTRDETTAQVAQGLFRVVSAPDDLRRTSLPRLEKLLFPVGFYRTKARHLKRLPVVLDDLFDGRIPDTIDDLCRLPGVGRKTANLVRSVAFDKPAICVDVHVHRICNRLGLLSTSTPHATEMTLREILPRRYWKTWNRYLVSYGQTVCTPLRPGCGECAIARYCDRVGTATARSRRKKT